MADVLLCKDCKYFSDGNCDSPLNRKAKPDYVNGGETLGNPTWYGAQYCREDKNACGPAGNWFEPKGEK